jgi:hypothetical protein
MLSSVYGHNYLTSGILRIPGHERVMMAYTKEQAKLAMVAHESQHRTHAVSLYIRNFFNPPGAKSRRNFLRMRDMYLKKQRAYLLFRESQDALRLSGIVETSKSKLACNHPNCKDERRDPVTAMETRVLTLVRRWAGETGVVYVWFCSNRIAVLVRLRVSLTVCRITIPGRYHFPLESESSPLIPPPLSFLDRKSSKKTFSSCCGVCRIIYCGMGCVTPATTLHP